MPADVETITRTEFEHYRSVVGKVSTARDMFALWGLAAVMGPIVTSVSFALARSPQDGKFFLYAGASLTAIACYEMVKHGREYRTLLRELTTIDSQYHSI